MVVVFRIGFSVEVELIVLPVIKKEFISFYLPWNMNVHVYLQNPICDSNHWTWDILAVPFLHFEGLWKL